MVKDVSQTESQRLSLPTVILLALIVCSSKSHDQEYPGAAFLVPSSLPLRVPFKGSSLREKRAGDGRCAATRCSWSSACDWVHGCRVSRQAAPLGTSAAFWPDHTFERPIALARYEHWRAVMEQTIQRGRGRHCISKDLLQLTGHPVAGHDDALALVPGRYQFEQELAPQAG